MESWEREDVEFEDSEIYKVKAYSRLLKHRAKEKLAGLF